MWAELNDLLIPPSHFIYQPEQINSGDIIFAFTSHLFAKPLTAVASSSDLITVWRRPDIFKVAHLSHYVFDFEDLVRNLTDFGVNMLCYESNLAKSRFFQRYAPHIREVVAIPFAVQDRFSFKKEMPARDRRCVATGGINQFKLVPNLKEFFFEFSANNFNPMRNLLFENQEMLFHYLVVNMTRFEASLKETQRFSFNLEDWRAALARPSSAVKALNREPSYYATNFVELFNTYQLSYVSEEISHAPALGFFESMACGAIPIGIDNFIYNDIGLKPGINYLPFDGSLGSLLSTIKTAWGDPQIIEPMVNENLGFVERCLRQERVAEKFIYELIVRYDSWCTTGNST
jgi:hypothetical protein